MTAMIRNLGKMTSIGLISPNSDAAKAGWQSGWRMREAAAQGPHPSDLGPDGAVDLQEGHGMKGNLSWSPVPRVVNALEKAFYLSFANAPKTGKRFYIGWTCQARWEAATSLARFDAEGGRCSDGDGHVRTEPEYYIAGFTNGSISSAGRIVDMGQV